MHAMNCRCPACAATGQTMARPQPPRYGTAMPTGARAPAPAKTALPGTPGNASGRWVRRGRTIVILDA